MAGSTVQHSVWNNLIAEIHASGKQCVIAITGGGSLAIGELLQIPGGSRSVLEAVVPYAAPALEDFLGGTPDQFCSEPTSRAMAMAAWMRARTLAPQGDPYSLVGIGCTASLVSTTPKRGEHRIHVGLQSAKETASFSLILSKGARNREEEEELATQIILLALGEAAGLCTADAYQDFEKHLDGNEHLLRRSQSAMTLWTQLLLGEAVCVTCGANVATKPKIVFPGAFNPLHVGHREMARIASERLDGEVTFELSITNVDKPSLDFIEIQDRLDAIQQQLPEQRVVLTAAPTFREKAKLLPGTTFVVGLDTLVRIADPYYYGNDERARDRAIFEIAHARCRFLVFGRELSGEYCCLIDLDLPGELQELCEEVPASEFREDVSSSELRNG